MTKKRRKFITDSDNSDDEKPNKSRIMMNESSDSLSESSEEEEWTVDSENKKLTSKRLSKRDDKKNHSSNNSMESSPDEGELTPSENESLTDESDEGEFDDGLDEHCIGDDEDRNKLMNMTEAERERVLFERMEKRESMKTRQEIQRKLKLQKRKEEAAKIDADKKKAEQESKAALRAQRARKPANDDKGKNKAIDELKAKRLAHKEKMKVNEGRQSPTHKPLLKTKDVYTDDEDEDEKSLSSSQSSESDNESDGDSGLIMERNISNCDQLSKIRLSRFKLEKWVHCPFFKSLVSGCYIRIGIGDKLGKKIYRVAEIFDVVETPKVYVLGQLKTNKGLKVRHGTSENMYRLEFVSNQDFTDSEFQKWKATMENCNMKLPTVKFIDEKAKAIKEALEHEYTNEEIDFIVKEKNKFRKNPRNFAQKKSDILMQKQMAETMGDYGEVEKLKADLEDLETEADRKSKIQNKGLNAISYINDKNRISTTLRIEEVLRKEYAAEKISDPSPFRRRKTVPSIVTPKFQDKQSEIEIFKRKLREEQEQREKPPEPEVKARPVLSEKKFDDPFELHTNCDIDIDIDIGPSSMSPPTSQRPSSSAQPKRGLNLSDYKKRTGLM